MKKNRNRLPRSFSLKENESNWIFYLLNNKNVGYIDSVATVYNLIKAINATISVF